MHQKEKMTNQDYKNYSLQQLDNWVHDALSTSDVTPKEIYDCIVNVVQDNINCYQKNLNKSTDLMSLLKGHRPINFDGCISPFDHNDLGYPVDSSYSCDTISFGPSSSQTKFVYDKSKDPYHDDMISAGYTINSKGEWSREFDSQKMSHSEWHKTEWEKGRKKWTIPVEVDGASGEYFITLPDDMLDQLDWEENDVLNWTDKGDGSFELRKVVVF